MSTANKLNYLKNNLDELKELTGEDVLADVVSNVKENYGHDWMPEPDWWDIDRILEEDTENYAGKMIILISDSEDNASIRFNGAVKAKTSDGFEYTQNTNHIWDKTKDKECSLGFKTRYIIYYYNSTFNYSSLYYPSALYAILKNLTINTPATNRNSWNPFINSKGIECLIFKDCNFINNNFPLNFGNVLKKVKGYANVNHSNVDYMYNNCNILKIDVFPEEPTSMNGCFNGAYNIFYIPYIDTSHVTNFRDCFRGCKVKVIESLDFNSATSIVDTFTLTQQLVSIKHISNIKISNLNFNACTLLNHETLMKILNALYDYSREGGTHTITLGTTNLGKLTEEEIEIGQDKGWTIN